MSIHEHLPPQARKELKEDGWTKALELARAVQEGWAAVRLGNLVARALTAKRSVQAGVEKELTGRDSEPWEIVYFKLYKTQIPVFERAIETAALMLGADQSRGYCLEMICADFLAGANLDNDN